MYDEYVGEDMNPDEVDADIVAFSAITPGITRAYKLAGQPGHHHFILARPHIYSVRNHS